MLTVLWCTVDCRTEQQPRSGGRLRCVWEADAVQCQGRRQENVPARGIMRNSPGDACRRIATQLWPLVPHNKQCSCEQQKVLWHKLCKNENFAKARVRCSLTKTTHYKDSVLPLTAQSPGIARHRRRTFFVSCISPANWDCQRFWNVYQRRRGKCSQSSARRTKKQLSLNGT